ncbi:uncharacterized protein [Hoplias malabaricus]|uniref:uncharacterized protein n=1 Tax=Hoplias malabaricus TaxID=27720 RepID=UPI003462B1EE
MALEQCPICEKFITCMSQHLRVSHGVVNKKERKLLLQLVSGKVDVRTGICPVAGCNTKTSRMDRHLKTHNELSKPMQTEVLNSLKRKMVLKGLSELRESQPDVPMASILDIEEQQRQEELLDISVGAAAEDVPCPHEEEEETVLCQNPLCVKRDSLLQMLQKQISDLTDTNVSLTKEVHLLRRQNRLLQRRVMKKPLIRMQVSHAAQAPPHPCEGSDVGPEKSDSMPEEPSMAQAPSLEKAPESKSKLQFPFPDHIPELNELLANFQHHQEGPDPSTKLKYNVQCKVFRIQNFISFMAHQKSNLASLTFLDNVSKIREWFLLLSAGKILPSTLAQYLKDVALFIKYVKETPPLSCRLSKRSLVNIQREFKGIIKKQRRSLVVHQLRVKTGKSNSAISKETLLNCRALAKVQIPRIIEQLQLNRSIKLQREFYGYVTAYFSCIYGHRTGVYQNMKLDEVQNASYDEERDVYLIGVECHKTNEAFGVAQLLLTSEEYGWLKSFIPIRQRLMGTNASPYYFSTSTPNSCKNLNEYMQKAWSQMKLPGKPKFTDFRSSIATHARNELAPGDRLKVTRFMCHDVGTADKFYAMNLNTKEAADHRALFENLVHASEEQQGPASATSTTTPEPPSKRRKKATLMEADSSKRRKKATLMEADSSKRPRTKPTQKAESSETSEEDIAVPYQESGTSLEESLGSMEEEEEEQGEEHEEAKPTPSLRRQPYVLLQRSKLLSPLKLRSASPRRHGVVEMAQQKGKNEKIRRAVKRALNL